MMRSILSSANCPCFILVAAGLLLLSGSLVHAQAGRGLDSVVAFADFNGDGKIDMVTVLCYIVSEPTFTSDRATEHSLSWYP
jgi:hypothetical protein